MVLWYWSVDTLIWEVSVDYNMMSFIHKVHGKPRLHVSANLLFGAWLPCYMTPPSSPSCAPANTASHDNHEKTVHGFPLLSMGMGLFLAAFGHRSSATSKILGCYNDHWIYLTVDIVKSVWLIACPCILTGTSSWLLMQESCKTAAWWDHCTSTYSNEAYFTDMHFLTQEQHSEKCILKESDQSFTNTNQISLALIKFDLDKEQ